MFDPLVGKSIALSSLPEFRASDLQAVVSVKLGEGSGRWRTGIQADPWMMVDAGFPVQLDVVTARFPKEMLARKDAVQVLASADAATWLPASTATWEQDADGCAVTARFEGAETRFIKIVASGQGALWLKEITSSATPTRTALISLSKAQFGQDVWAATALGMRTDGFYVELGAADGITFSNCYVFEKYLNWTGICVEANPENIAGLTSRRPAARIEHAALSGESGQEIEFVVSGLFGAVSDRYVSSSRGERRVRLGTISLNDVLAKHDAPNVIDFLSMDIEGSEAAVLRTFDFARHRVLLWCIEYNQMGDEMPTIRQRFEENGYTIHQHGIDWMVVHESVPDGPRKYGHR